MGLSPLDSSRDIVPDATPEAAASWRCVRRARRRADLILRFSGTIAFIVSKEAISGRLGGDGSEDGADLNRCYPWT